MSIAAKQAAAAVPRKLQEALDALDNFEALHRLTSGEAAVWAEARKHLLGAMGCMVTVEASKPEPVA